CVTRATSLPSSSKSSVSTTIVRLPLWSARDTAWTRPPRIGPRKFVFDSIVAVPFASWGRFRNARKPPAESATDISAPPPTIPPPGGGALLRAPRELRSHRVRGCRHDLHPEEPGVGRRRGDLRSELPISVHDA